MAPTGGENSDLARVVEAWPVLPEPIRRAVLALVETATPAVVRGLARWELDDAVPPGYERRDGPTVR